MRFPDYSRQADGWIPESVCFDVVRVMADFGGAYLWDMNGVCITVADITGNDRDEPLDELLEKWSLIYDSNRIGQDGYPLWESEEAEAKFNTDGLLLSEKLFEFLGRQRTVVYRDSKLSITRFDPPGCPPVRLDDL